MNSNKPEPAEYITATSRSGMVYKLALHLQMQTIFGPTVVIAQQPIALMSVLRKNWKQIERQTLKERARTLDPIKIAANTAELSRLSTLKFSRNPLIKTDILLLEPTQIHQLTQNFATIYLYDLDYKNMQLPSAKVVAITQSQKENSSS